MPCESFSCKSGKLEPEPKNQPFRLGHGLISRLSPTYFVGLPSLQNRHARDKVFSGDTLLFYECILELF
jgi:hypothetical protein